MLNADRTSNYLTQDETYAGHKMITAMFRHQQAGPNILIHEDTAGQMTTANGCMADSTTHADNVQQEIRYPKALERCGTGRTTDTNSSPGVMTT